MDMINTVGNMIHEIDTEIGKRVNRQLKDSDMTMSQMGLLLQLADAPDGILTISEIGKKIHVAQPTATGLVNRLAKKQLVKILSDPNDKRVRNILITQKGRLICQQGEANMQQMERRLLRSLDGDERQQLLTMLIKVRNDLI